MFLKTRETKLISVSDFIKIDIANYSQLRLINPEKPKTGRAIDIGSLIYSKRMPNNEINSKLLREPTPVDLNSIKGERIKFVRSLPNKLLNKRPRTINSYLTSYIKVFDWMDNNGFEDFLKSEQCAYDAYLAYTQELERRVKVSSQPEQITPRTAKDMQWAAREVLKLAFPEKYEEIVSGVVQLLGKADPKLPVGDDYLLYYWDVNKEIFDKFSQQCFNNKYYPPLIETPDFTSYYIPARATMAKLDSPFCSKKKLPHFDYTRGKVKPFEQLKVQQEKGNYLKSVANYNKGKSTPRNTNRLNMAKRALHAFVELFRMLTTCNQSTLLNLKYETVFEDTRDFFDNEFRDVKFRASNRLITLRLHEQGYKLFKKYLKLRKWLLDGEHCEWLFFSAKEGSKVIPRKLAKQHTDKHHSSLKKSGFIPCDAQPLQDTQLRAANTVYLRERGFSQKDIADNNNHSLRTSEERYSRPTLEKQKAELGNYWDAFKLNSIAVKNIDTDSIATGSCKVKKEKLPESIIPTPPIEPNCKTTQGCLFCVYYVCHCDEEDIRKLLSVLFITTELRQQTTEIQFADEVYNLLILRINEILRQIRSKSQELHELVDRIHDEVFNMCELTQFWQRRLDYYEELGVLIV